MGGGGLWLFSAVFPELRDETDAPTNQSCRIPAASEARRRGACKQTSHCRGMLLSVSAAAAVAWPDSEQLEACGRQKRNVRGTVQTGEKQKEGADEAQT